MSLISNKNKNQKGQTLIAAVALLAVACVMLFVVFNSGRAVNEKINLVNAADAAAYSGAQVAARHLNFMAYTNRAMIANEVAIGHLFSYQAEVDVMTDAWQVVQETPQIQWVLNILEWLVPGFTEQLDQVDQAMQDIADASRVLTNMMMLMYNANSANFGEFQQQAYRDLIAQTQRPELNGQSLSIVGATMQVVANTYAVRDNAPILVNDQAVLGGFAADPDPAIAGAVTDAASYDQQICELISFANPSADGSSTASANGASCQGLINGSNANIGVADSDGGYLIDAIRETYMNMDSGLWIRNRNVSYFMLGVLRTQRRGETQVLFQDGHITWGTDGDQITIAGSSGEVVQGDVNSFIQQAGDFLDANGLQALSNMGLCTNGQTSSGQSCMSLLNDEYRSIQRYAVLDDGSDSAVVSAFLSQENCSDSIGFDEDGNPIEGWNNDLRYLEERRPVCGKSVYAVAQAEVFYQRPDCYDPAGDCDSDDFGFAALANGEREAANLFNPFWHVRLVPTGGD